MFTGALSITRSEAQSLIEEKGGIAGASVTKNTDYLVVGSKPGSKVWKAQQLGTTILTEQELWDLLKEPVDSEEIILTQGQLDGTEELPWAEIAKLGITIMTSSQLERLLRHSEPSYQNPDKLRQLLLDYPVDLLPPQVCRYCQMLIPYSIHTDDYYCFNCNQYMNHFPHNHCWVDLGLGLPKTSLGSIYLACKICGDFLDFSPFQVEDVFSARRARNYHNSVESLLDRPVKMELPPEKWVLLADIPVESGSYWMNELDERIVFVSSADLEGFAEPVDLVSPSLTESPSGPQI